MSQQASLQETNALEEQAIRAAQLGKEAEAVKLWERVLDIDPRHARALALLGQHAFRRGDLASAQVLFERLVGVHGGDPQPWIRLALVCRGLGDQPGEDAAIAGALTADPQDLVALLLRGDLRERQGRHHEAAFTYGAAMTVAPPIDRLAPDLRPALSRAAAFREQYNADFAAFMERHLEPAYKEHAGENLHRFRDSVDIVLGRKRRFDSQSTFHHYPGLPTIEFFDRADFPWLDDFEAATDAVRDEFLAVLKGEDGFVPYINYSSDLPLNQWAELNNSPNWSAFHLHKAGERVEENALKCPATMQLLAGAPQPYQPGRTPSAMFSLLKPKTRIPPHTGASNVRLVVHLPLIVPDGCRFRVGNQVRAWIPGKAWVFDDTIEHEAWNDSDKLRVVLLFDIWHPMLSLAEREMISAMGIALSAFQGPAGDFSL